MKKFLSILIATLLIVGMFTACSVAFAEESDGGETETPALREVTIDYDELIKCLAGTDSDDDSFYNLKIEMGKFKFNSDWLKDREALDKVFSGLKYVLESEEGYDDKKSDNDKIYVEYCTPTQSPNGQKNWQNSALLTSEMTLSSSGSYLFRIVVKDKDNETLAVSDSFSRVAEDTKHPVVSLSSSMNTKHDDGLVVGTTYTIVTSLTIEDASNTVVTYVVDKKVNGEWVEEIYNSETKEVKKGYEKYISTSGVITPSEDDVISTKENPDYIYRIRYSVVDANGYYGVAAENSTTEENPTLTLFVKAAPDDGKKSVLEIWKIVLFVIAGLSAVGIVVLLCIKPKQATETVRAESVKNVEAESEVEDKE
ncbi:MAG: hypothetical protein NC099_01210 [Corallococcus sp.]|nr:hypothetical protein [Bacillota bacterium]MCM1533253.1 hypothetical protein [Corallococcus sp.]